MATDALTTLTPVLESGANTTQSWIGTIVGASEETYKEYKQLGDDLLQSSYKFNYLVFPNDLGRDDSAHYMIININVPTSTGGQAPAGNFTNRVDFNTQLASPERSKVDKLRYGNGAGVLGAGAAGNAAGITIPRFTRRIADSIALFMPTPLIYNTQHAYEDVSLTALGGKLGIGAAGLIPGIGGGLAKGLSAVGSVASGALKISGNPINPAVEILYSTTALRQFTFELLLAPRNVEESYTIENIIKKLRFHAAPEINTLSRGLTWIPPADFDITFFRRGVENDHLIRINTCVLQRIEVDFSPTSGIYSTFTNGFPVAVRLSLGFMELEPVHKQRVTQGF
jgi:hypothetical protein